MLGVTGGIAAYKAVEVCRRLVDAGAHVMPVMTEGCRALPRRDDAVGAGQRAGADESVGRGPSPIPHTRLGQSADLVLVVPATARLIAAYAAGLRTDLLTNTLLATRAPVVICPAMHTEMWEHPAVDDNMAMLRGAAFTSSSPSRDVSPAATSAPVASPRRSEIVAAVERVLAAATWRACGSS